MKVLKELRLVVILDEDDCKVVTEYLSQDMEWVDPVTAKRWIHEQFRRYGEGLLKMCKEAKPTRQVAKPTKT